MESNGADNVAMVPELVMEGNAAMTAVERANIDSAVATAKQYPRSIETFRKRAMEMATLNEDIAAACNYALPRAGKPIEGPSVRLLEIALCTYGNCQARSFVSRIDEKFVYAVGFCRDLENNVTASVEIPRRITYSKDKGGGRFSDDMIGVTQRAACAIAFREAVGKVIPRVFVDEIAAAAKAVAIGTEKTLGQRRTTALRMLAQMGVTNDRVFATLGVEGENEIDLDKLAVLRGHVTALKDGDGSAETLFPSPAPPGTQQAGAKGAAARGRARKPRGAKDKPKPEPEEQPTPDEELVAQANIKAAGGNFDEQGCSEVGCTNVATAGDGVLYPHKPVFCGSAKNCPRKRNAAENAGS